jgi:hypothetical protein
LHVLTVTDALRTEYGIAFPPGALVTALQTGSPADRAGIPAGAVIESIDGAAIASEEDVVNYVANSQVGQEVVITYRYNETARDATVRLEAGPTVAARPTNTFTLPETTSQAPALGTARSSQAATRSTQRTIPVEAPPARVEVRRRPLRRLLLPGGFRFRGGSAVERLESENERLRRRNAELERALELGPPTP